MHGNPLETCSRLSAASPGECHLPPLSKDMTVSGDVMIIDTCVLYTIFGFCLTGLLFWGLAKVRPGKLKLF